MLNLYRIDENYGGYMWLFDEKVPDMAREKNKRPFVGVVIAVGSCSYYAPLSSPKPKHLHMHTAIDFMKIEGGKFGVINFNNMLPVSNEQLVLLDLKIKRGDDENTVKYKLLLTNQKDWCTKHQDLLSKKAGNLYTLFKEGKLYRNIVDRCCNFELLEKAMKIYDPNYDPDQIRVLKKAIMQNVKLSEITDPDIPAVQMEKILNTDRAGKKEKM